MRVVFMLRSLLGRWLLFVGGVAPLVIWVVVLGGPTVVSGIAVWLMGVVGWMAGVFANDLGKWPNRTLVPGYSKALFHAVLVVLVLVPLGCGILWTMVGNPPPPLGSGLLWGTLMTLCVVRFRGGATVLTTGIVGILGLGLYLMWAAKQELHPAVFESLTDLRLQIPALAFAALALIEIRRTLNAPLSATTPVGGAARREPLQDKLARLRSTGAVQERFEAHFHLQPVCEPQRLSRNLTGPRPPPVVVVVPLSGLHAGLRREVVASLPLVVLALLLAFLVRTGVTTDSMSIVFTIACLVYALTRVVVSLSTLHAHFRSYWLSGAVETRRSLGRKCALVILMRGLGWLPAGLVGAAILALGVHRTAPYDRLFVITLTLLLMIALIGSVRRIPATTRWWQLLTVIAVGSGLTTPIIHVLELGWAVRSALVVGLAGLAVVTWYAVARALARAEIVQ